MCRFSLSCCQIKPVKMFYTICLVCKAIFWVLRKKQLVALYFSLMLLNLIKSSILNFIFAILAYMQGGLRKKQLITSFLKHFMKNKKKHYMCHFQVHNPKLSQEWCFKTYIYYTRLCTGCSAKEVIDSKFCKALYRK